MKAIVTGGSGFIGSYITQELIKQNIATIVYDNFSTGNLENLSSIFSQIQTIEADIIDLDQLQSAMKGVDYVFHLAAHTSVTGSLVNPLLTNQVNNTGTLNVLWAALQAKVSKVIIASSCSVYGDRHQPPLQETYLPNPKSPYAASKLIAEALAESFYHSYGLETVCLRYFNVYGLRQRADSDYAAVIPRFIECYQQKKSPHIYGTGQQSRDFIHVSDIAKANLLAATLPSSILKKHRIFNIGTGNETNLLELLNLISKQKNYYLEPVFLPFRQGEIEHSCADISLAQEKLGFKPLISLEEGIKSLL
ncbi:NAD-dependent epimerase/dehydratase family protein [Nostoc sphaeroides]|uniref:GalE, UDP-glucose 4-epimerase n=1 Tax=Nostoc sphaeroides CCNUC1 TaxID=2653204 RepID=A0A5P8VY45_9NOSO|nr:NAD-dependent epimerase/dehydratase family protein [Nostoc sphaeroides]QFS45335.1 galE, UDP-glucose 4-epimerase [Nostoc sphaeroides CCNUC1]